VDLSSQYCTARFTVLIDGSARNEMGDALLSMLRCSGRTVMGQGCDENK